MPKSTKLVFKAALDTESKEAKVTLTPEPKDVNSIIAYINSIVSTVPPTLLSLGMNLPMMRPVTEEEMALGQYIMVGDDAKLYKARRAIYDALKTAFNTTFDNMFPDVVYKIGCEQYNQETAFEKTPEELELFKKQVEELNEKILDKFTKEVHDSEES